MVQEVGYAMMKARGLELIAADKPDSFLDDTPTAVLIWRRKGQAVSRLPRSLPGKKQIPTMPSPDLHGRGCARMVNQGLTSRLSGWGKSGYLPRALT
jgi:hypothetical protein